VLHQEMYWSAEEGLKGKILIQEKGQGVVQRVRQHLYLQKQQVEKIKEEIKE
jgi:hypothetical protein